MIKIGNVKAGRVRIYKFNSFKALTKKENDIRNDKDKGNDYLLEEIAKNESIRSIDRKYLYYKDKEGKVIAVNHKKNTVIVEGVNIITKHTKPSVANQNGGIIHQEAPIAISNVMYSLKGKATRIGFKMDGDKKVRYAKATGEVID